MPWPWLNKILYRGCQDHGSITFYIGDARTMGQKYTIEMMARPWFNKTLYGGCEVHGSITLYRWCQDHGSIAHYRWCPDHGSITHYTDDARTMGPKHTIQVMTEPWFNNRWCQDHGTKIYNTDDGKTMVHTIHVMPGSWVHITLYKWCQDHGSIA